ncbi:sulfotransferase family 2 domain-containing protein [Aquisalimonas lutea]|uniref:sulfotransferase family 2 domain-containing protein n=1 Tax=Aquisalimonas lutea TaxID=1327750 RepID=UPI0025B44152|nr:sulfotransferase family 2 domain-containing protein [Aquisalimonas lutea]MDN3516815.1 sulfotransferase family 2 domain-containing protein [Aquisalimonas lutea]
MLISYSRNFLFVHIAKTGGTSVRAALRKYRWGGWYSVPLGLASVASQMTRPRHKLGLKFPRHAKAIAALEMLPTEVFEGFFKFTVVRNPWDLQVSSYHHIQREKPEVLAGILTFEDFLRRKFDPERPYDFMLDISAERQHEYLVNLRGELIVDFIGRYERLQADFNRICEHIGVTAPALPHLRRADDREDYRRYYTDELAELVARHYQRDLDLLGYRFDPPETASAGA